jgi:hypothetical protein
MIAAAVTLFLAATAADLLTSLQVFEAGGRELNPFLRADSRPEFGWRFCLANGAVFVALALLTPFAGWQPWAVLGGLKLLAAGWNWIQLRRRGKR